MKNSADLGGCYLPRPSASVNNTLLDLQNSPCLIQPHSIIAKYLYVIGREVQKTNTGQEKMRNVYSNTERRP